MACGSICFNHWLGIPWKHSCSARPIVRFGQSTSGLVRSLELSCLREGRTDRQLSQRWGPLGLRFCSEPSTFCLKSDRMTLIGLTGPV